MWVPRGGGDEEDNGKSGTGFVPALLGDVMAAILWTLIFNLRTWNLFTLLSGDVVKLVGVMV